MEDTMNKNEFTALKSWFEKAKPVLREHENIARRMRASGLFLVKTSWDELCFSDAHEVFLSSVNKRFPQFYAQVGESGYLNHNELDCLFSNMRKEKDLRALLY